MEDKERARTGQGETCGLRAIWDPGLDLGAEKAKKYKNRNLIEVCSFLILFNTNFFFYNCIWFCSGSVNGK